jgi:ADP-ribosylglycohydrolase
LRAARWALVYARFAHSHRLRVMGAVRVAAARALRLRQNSINACC